MNPQQLYLFQQLMGMGYSQQQAFALATGSNAPSMATSLQSGQGINQALGQIMQLLGGYQALNSVQQPYNLQMKAAKTAMSPAAFMARYGQFYQPLSRQLINNVTEDVGPSLAERGMATSPGQTASVLGQALAPYEMQEQNTAMNAALGTMQPSFQVGSGLAGQLPSSLVDFPLLMSIIGSQP